MTDAYKVPDLAPGAFHRAEETVRRSRFIVTMARVSSPEEAKAFIDRIREEHAGATHNCWAYNAGAPGDTAQVGASDDGEPKGTAGRPMLTALLHSDVGEVAAVVTRYFGGILLGTGGLVRAYQGSVKLGLEGLPVTLREDMRRFVVSIEPHQVSDFQHFLAESRGRVQSSDFRLTQPSRCSSRRTRRTPSSSACRRPRRAKRSSIRLTRSRSSGRFKPGRIP